MKIYWKYTFIYVTKVYRPTRTALAKLLGRQHANLNCVVIATVALEADGMGTGTCLGFLAAILYFFTLAYTNFSFLFRTKIDPSLS